MRDRQFVFWVYVLNFLVGLFAVGYILTTFGGNLEVWEISFYIYSLLLAFCGVAIAYWVAEDGKYVEQLVDEVILKLEERDT